MKNYSENNLLYKYIYYKILITDNIFNIAIKLSFLINNVFYIQGFHKTVVQL